MSSAASGSGSGSSAVSPPPAKRRRSRTGCLTCRLRKKRCDETRPTCRTCTRLGLECLGFAEQRPGWMRDPDVVAGVSDDLRKSLNDAQAVRRSQMWAERAAQARSEGRLPSPPPPPPPSVPPPIQPSLPPVDTPLSAPPLDPFAPAAPSIPTAASIPNNDDDNDDIIHLSTSTGIPTDAADLSTASTDFLDELAQFLPQGAQAGSPELDPALVQLLCPVRQPAPRYTAFTASDSAMRYFAHYLGVILPFQWPFERAALSSEVTPLAFSDPVVFEGLAALGALHMGARRGALGGPEREEAEGALARSVRGLQRTPLARFARHEVVVAAMSVASFHLFAGGNRRGWPAAVATCRRCLAAVALHGDLAGLRHLLAPLVWTDIQASVTEGRASAFIGLYRGLLLDASAPCAPGAGQGGMGQYLRETVMGCDSTTRLAIAETMGLSEWKDAAVRAGRLSVRDLLHRATGIERLLAQRAWSEAHLLAPADRARRAVSDVFFRAAHVLLATVVNGPHPAVPEVGEAVRGVADAFAALDALGAEMDRALVFPTVIAGCHAAPELRPRFEERFHKVGPDAEFGNTRNALALMQAVWARRDRAGDGAEVHWRAVMYELNPEGLLLI